MTLHVRRFVEEEWSVLRDIRLKALKADPGVFGSSYDKESKMHEADWRRWLTNPDVAVFGVFDNNDVVGLTGVALDRDDPTKKKAVLWGSWLPAHLRGKGLSKTMYEARLEWARQHPTCEKVVVTHRASNIASKKANQKHGFVFTHVGQKQWPDGTISEEYFYELYVKPQVPTGEPKAPAPKY